MKIVIAPDKFKGSLRAPAVANAIAEGVRRAFPEAVIDLCPMADGGEGTVDALVSATGGRICQRTVVGPLPDMEVVASFGMLGTGEAVIEMAAASGLALLSAEQQNPMRTTTFGTGQLIRAAVDGGAKRILLGIGGSATVDGGIGCAQACGSRIYVESAGGKGELVRPATGADLRGFDSMTRPEVPISIVVACDVSNPLLGSEGAARVFGPQKGATAEMILELEGGLRRLADRTGRLKEAEMAGSGAAGGLGFAMRAFFNATLRSGIDLVVEASRLSDRLRDATLCITGEGRLDDQSLAGKAPVGIARLCQKLGVPCIALAGSLDLSTDQVREAGFVGAFAIAPQTVGISERINHAADFLRISAESALRQVVV